jgi:hypothetical protein
VAIRATISLVKVEAATSIIKVETQTTYENSNATEIWIDPDSNNRMFTEELPLSDVTIRVVNKVLADNSTITDLYASHFTKGTIVESVSVADTFARVVAYNRDFTDAFTLDDLSQIDKDFYGNKGNIFAFTDIIGLTNNKNLTDSYSFSDVIEIAMAYSRIFTDPFTFNDESSYQLGKSIQGVSESVSMSDLITTAIISGAVLNGGIPLNRITLN